LPSATIWPQAILATFTYVIDRRAKDTYLTTEVSPGIHVVRYAYGQAANWQNLEDAARQAIGAYRYAPYSELYPSPAELAARVVR
jgi:hypothetical protein